MSTPELDALHGRITREGQCSGQASGEDADRWFPVGQASTYIRKSVLEMQAQEACAGCPVMAECAQWAVANREKFGIWGGMAEHQLRATVRADLRATRTRQAKAVAERAPEPNVLRMAEVIECGRAAEVSLVHATLTVAEVA